MISILSFGCSTNAGRGAEALWRKLESGEPAVESPWKKTGSSEDLLLQELGFAFQEATSQLSPTAVARIRTGSRLGVILASTKGVIEDFVWREDIPAETWEATLDPIEPLLSSALKAFELNPGEKICISNACASSLAALTLAEMWIKRGRVDDVIILSADYAGPFVRKGFQSLRVLTPDKTMPFAGNRSGFHLGDAASAIVVSKFSEGAVCEILKSAIDSEGYAVSRPSHSGDSLHRACSRVGDLSQIDLIIAHGTATQPNDAIEDRVFGRLFGDTDKKTPWVTNTKWCVGHTLGVSGLIDVIAAAEVLRRQKVFRIASTSEVDSNFTGKYLISNSETAIGPVREILVTSLGFGGVHSAVHLAVPLATARTVTS
ncbi:MAG: beta-ketoacyl synthase N-terminal-like domain-containing protein [Bdellovibrionota bacterium]